MKPWIKPLLKMIIPIAVILILFQFGKLYGIAAIVVLLIYLGFKLRTNVYVAQANARFAKKDLPGAAEGFDKAYKASKKPAYAVSRAFVLLKNGQAQDAIQLLEDILKQSLPRTEEMNAKVNYALALWMTGKEDQALEVMEAVFADFKNTIGYGNLRP